MCDHSLIASLEANMTALNLIVQDFNDILVFLEKGYYGDRAEV